MAAVDSLPSSRWLDRYSALQGTPALDAASQLGRRLQLPTALHSRYTDHTTSSLLDGSLCDFLSILSGTWPDRVTSLTVSWHEGYACLKLATEEEGEALLDSQQMQHALSACLGKDRSVCIPAGKAQPSINFQSNIVSTDQTDMCHF